ncbi:MAG: hypothetical protein Q7S58_17690 [Candidatus Binatus sp.]|nr:hypothetical protein [Candidatus Binatus sp.]
MALALGLAACAPIQSSPTTGGVDRSSSVGGSGAYGTTSHPAAPSSAGTVVGGTIDSSQSQALSDYLKHHSLPLVGAQVVSSPSGGRQAILFGFVATDFGKSDAEQKARNYLKDPTLVVDNRIKVSPELANSKGGSTPNPAPSYQSPDGTDPYGSTGSVQDYQNNLPPDAYAYQQQGAGQYPSYGSAYGGTAGSSSGLLMMMGLLGMMGGGGMSMGSGGFGGGSYGGFSSGYRTYGGYPSYPSYPSYPPPSSYRP